MTMRTRLLHIFIWITACSSPGPAIAREQWSKEQAGAWYAAKPWLVGCNFIPSTAINQLEMWQAETFDLATIDHELGWAEVLGFNSLRVFHHHMQWDQDREGLLRRMEQFLVVADRHKIGVMFVPLDAVWDPFPKLGPQRTPRPGLHNSGWVQSPGVDLLKDLARHSELEGYIQGVIGHFRGDARIHAWDLFNEPENRNGSSYGKDEPANKSELSLALLKRLYKWARAVDPSQPITSGVWTGEWTEQKLTPINRFQLEESDVITFHDYSPLPVLKSRVETLKRFGRPILCTEYMARPTGSNFDPNLGYLREQKVGAYNWGFVAGKSQTIYPWDSWQKPYAAEPKIWFHDIFRADGTPFDAKEVEYLRRMTGKGQ